MIVLSNRFIDVDPLAEKYIAWSPYNYGLNNPIRMTDPDGRSSEVVNGDPIVDIKQTIANAIAPLQKNVSEAVDYTKSTVAPVIGAIAGVVGTVADIVQYAALGATALTGGSSSPITIPIAVTAEYVGTGALVVQASAELIEKGNLENTGSEILVKAVAGTAGELASNSIKSIKDVSSATKEATNAVAQSVISTAEKVANNVISKAKINSTSSKQNINSTQSIVYNFTVTD